MAALYAPRNTKARLPAWLETLQIRPVSPAVIMRLAQALETSHVPTTLTSSTRRNSSAGTVSSGPNPKPGPLPPAMLATSVTGPNSALTAATAASTAASSDTSATAVATGAPRAAISAASAPRSSTVAVPWSGASR